MVREGLKADVVNVDDRSAVTSAVERGLQNPKKRSEWARLNRHHIALLENRATQLDTLVAAIERHFTGSKTELNLAHPVKPSNRS